jgi:hypothetical protein
MSIESRRELELTRTKLKLLEDRLTSLAQKPGENRRAHEWEENPKQEISSQKNLKQKSAATDGTRIKHGLESVFVPCLIRGSMSSDFFAKKFRISDFPTGTALPRNPEPGRPLLAIPPSVC